MINYVTFILINFLLLIKLQNVNCLYEDQVGNWDWKQSYIGKIKFFHSLSLSKSQTNLVGTKSNILSSIYLRNGTINWRKALELNGNLQAFSLDDEQDGLNLDEYSVKELITVNNNGFYVRSWHPITGALNWEKRLPEELIKHKDDRSLINFKINSKLNEIIISKFYPTNDKKLILYFYIYDYLKDEIIKRDKQTLNYQLEDLHSCRFVSSRNLICLNSKNLTINHYSFDQINENNQLINFGFKQQQQIKSSSLDLIGLDYQTNENQPIFSLNLDGDSFALIRLINNKITLLKIFNNIKSLTFKKVNVNGILKTYVFILKFDQQQQSSSKSNQHLFKVVAYDLIEWQEIKTLQEYFNLKYKDNLLIEQFYILPFNKNQHDKYQYKIVISTKDGSFILISSSQGSSKINWIREESLANVISAEIIDYPLNDLG